MKCRTMAISERSLGRIARSLTLLVLSILLLDGSAVAQNGDIYIYPAKGQDKNKQDEDRYDCHSWAVSQTGFDPSKPQASAPNPAASQQYRPSQPHVLRGGARGAALGAVGGAITGNAGKGAAAGAAMVDSLEGFGASTREGSKATSSRLMLKPLNRISKSPTAVRWRPVSRVGATRSNRFTAADSHRSRWHFSISQSAIASG